MYKREIRTRFDLLRPSTVDHVEAKQLAQIGSSKGTRNKAFREGERVLVKDYGVRNENRLLGQITKKLSPVTYEVDVGRRGNWKRHTDQIIKGPTELRRSKRIVERKEMNCLLSF